MRSIKKGLEKYPIHPLVFGIYPVLFLWVDNKDEIPFFAAVRSLLFSIGLAIVVYALTSIIYRNFKKAAIIASIIIILALSYGHIYNFIESQPDLIDVIGYYRLLAILLLIVAICIVLVWKYKSSVRSVNQVMHVISFLLLVMIIGQIGWYFVSEVTAKSFLSNTEVVDTNETISNDYLDRDVYYIILDAYSREDLLKSRFDYDNSSFIAELKNLGFVIPECTQSNYDSTKFSMASSLNMNYLSELPTPILSTNAPKDQFELYITHSLVRSKFEAMGYLTVSFRAIYPYLNIEDADFYYDFQQSADIYNKLETENFQYLFFNTTVLRIIIEILEASPEYMFVEDASAIQVYIAKILYPQMKLFETRLFKQYEQNLYAFEKLEAIPDIPGNKFVYAHLFSTHQPFVFTPTGQVRWPVNENSEAYLDQITYTNTRMLGIIKSILNNSATPPIIILQGDHSYVQHDGRNKILNAYYLPEGGSEQITPDFSPVNTFRLIFNTYFGGDYEILPNIAYFSQEEYPYQFEALPPSCIE
jgi:hypothetical protein